jgi:hypothetical protein
VLPAHPRRQEREGYRVFTAGAYGVQLRRPPTLDSEAGEVSITRVVARLSVEPSLTQGVMSYSCILWHVQPAELGGARLNVIQFERALDDLKRILEARHLGLRRLQPQLVQLPILHTLLSCAPTATPKLSGWWQRVLGWGWSAG